MQRARLYVASFLLVVVPASVFPGALGRAPDDPLAVVEQALGQGRHWYAAQLLRQLKASTLNTPEAALLAARADAGRGAWRPVVSRLSGAAWLDSVSNGEGRALLARARLETGQYGRAVSDFRRFLGYSVEREPRALAEIGLARALDALGRSEEAAAAYLRASEIFPQLEPWTAIRAAESLAQTGDTAAVRVLLERAAAAPFARRVDADVDAHQAAGDPPGAAHILLGAARSRSAGHRAADFQARAAAIQLADGDTAAAGRVLRAAIRAQPTYARSAAELLARLPGLSVDDHQHLAVAFERSASPRRAAQQYQRYLELRQVSDTERQRLELKIGELLFRGGSNYAAIRVLEELLATDPDLAIASRAAYYIARATYRRGWRREGQARLREVADRYPGSASALRALALLADLYDGAGNVANARAIYEELVDGYGGTRTARDARFQLGILAFADGDYETARAYFDRVRRAGRADDLQLASLYWAARARLALGEGYASEADRLFRETHARDPFGYYGLLAAERAGIDPWEKLQAGPTPSAIAAEQSAAFQLIALLKRGGLTAEADAALDQLRDDRPRQLEDMLGLASAFAERGYGQEAVNIGWTVHARLRGIWSANVLRAIYPLNYEEIITAEAEAADVDPVLIAAIARQESAFTPDVVSRAGARGLLQIMPATGRWWADRLKLRDYDDDLLFHPEISVHLGTAYLADLLHRYDDLQIALIAYNAGPTRARSWREWPAYSIDPELFVERIPFSETRKYLRGVQTQIRIYRHLYGKDELTSHTPTSDASASDAS